MSEFDTNNHFLTPSGSVESLTTSAGAGNQPNKIMGATESSMDDIANIPGAPDPNTSTTSNNSVSNEVSYFNANDGDNDKVDDSDSDSDSTIGIELQAAAATATSTSSTAPKKGLKEFATQQKALLKFKSGVETVIDEGWSTRNRASFVHIASETYAEMKKREQAEEDEEIFKDSSIAPRLVLEQAALRLKEKRNGEDSYINLFQYTVFLIMYLFVLSYQKNSFDRGAQGLHEVLLGSVFGEEGGEFVIYSKDTDGVCSGDAPPEDVCDRGEFTGNSIGYGAELFESELIMDQNNFLEWFAVEVIGNIWSEREDASKPDAAPAQRTILTDNLVVVGPMLTTTRFADGVCSQTNFFDQAVCVNEEQTKQPYGRDLRFITGKPEFNQTLKKNMNSLFSAEELGTKSSNAETYGLPCAFFNDQLTSNTGSDGTLVAFGVRPDVTVENYPVVFDRRLTYDRVGELLLQLQNSQYLDENTKEIVMSMVLYNPKMDLFSSVVVTGTNSLDGTGMSIETHVSVLDLVVYNWDEDWFRICLEVIYYISLFGLLLREVHELKGFVKQYKLLGGILMYATNFGNMIDYTNYAIQALSNLSWVSFALMIHNWNPQLTYEVFDNDGDEIKFFRGGAELKDAMQVFTDISNFEGAMSIHSSLASISIVLCVIQFVKNLDFHPRMGLVSRTIGNAANDMIFFLMLFCTVVMIYSFLGMIQYGSSVTAFASVGDSFQTLLVMLLGEFGDFKEEMDDVSSGITTLFFWTFFIICYFILMNAFLAIIVEAYGNTKAGYDSISYTDSLGGLYRLISKKNQYGGKWRMTDDELIAVCEYVLGVESNPFAAPKVDFEDDTSLTNSENKDRRKEHERETMPKCMWEPMEVDPNMPRSTKAMIIRKMRGDTHEDGTMTESGGRIFFGEVHIYRSLCKNNLQYQIRDRFLAHKIAYNIVERFGIVADVDNDGVITNEEFLNLKVGARHGSVNMGFAVAALAAKAQELEEKTKRLSMNVANSAVHGANIGGLGDMVGDGFGAGLGAGLGGIGAGFDGARRFSAKGAGGLGKLGAGVGGGMLEGVAGLAGGVTGGVASVRRGSMGKDVAGGLAGGLKSVSGVVPGMGLGGIVKVGGMARRFSQSSKEEKEKEKKKENGG